MTRNQERKVFPLPEITETLMSRCSSRASCDSEQGSGKVSCRESPDKTDNGQKIDYLKLPVLVWPKQEGNVLKEKSFYGLKTEPIIGTRDVSESAFREELQALKDDLRQLGTHTSPPCTTQARKSSHIYQEELKGLKENMRLVVFESRDIILEARLRDEESKKLANEEKKAARKAAKLAEKNENANFGKISSKKTANSKRFPTKESNENIKTVAKNDTVRRNSDEESIHSVNSSIRDDISDISLSNTFTNTVSNLKNSLNNKPGNDHDTSKAINGFVNDTGREKRSYLVANLRPISEEGGNAGKSTPSVSELRLNKHFDDVNESENEISNEESNEQRLADENSDNFVGNVDLYHDGQKEDQYDHINSAIEKKLNNKCTDIIQNDEEQKTSPNSSKGEDKFTKKQFEVVNEAENCHTKTDDCKTERNISKSSQDNLNNNNLLSHDTISSELSGKALDKFIENVNEVRGITNEEVDFIQSQRIRRENHRDLFDTRLNDIESVSSKMTSRRSSSVGLPGNKTKDKKFYLDRYRVPKQPMEVALQLHKLGFEFESHRVRDLVASIQTCESNLKKAIAQEKKDVIEERKRAEREAREKERQEAQRRRLELQEEKEKRRREREAIERQMRRQAAIERRKYNLELMRNINNTILQSKASRSFRFSYFPFLPSPKRQSLSPSPSESDFSSDDESKSSIQVMTRRTLSLKTRSSCHSPRRNSTRRR